MVAEYKGYENHGKTVLSCLGCGKELITVFDVGGENAKSRKIRAKCGSCGDVSKHYESVGDIKISLGSNGESEYFSRIEMPDEEEGDVVTVLKED